MRSAAGSVCPPMLALALSLVRDSQPFATLGAAPLENDPTILRRHPDQEAMCLGPTTGVGLEGAFAFRHCDPAAAELNARASRNGTFNTSRGFRGVSTKVNLPMTRIQSQKRRPR